MESFYFMWLWLFIQYSLFLYCLSNLEIITATRREVRGEWPSGLYSLRQVAEVKLGRVRSDFGWVTTEA